MKSTTPAALFSHNHHGYPHQGHHHGRGQHSTDEIRGDSLSPFDDPTYTEFASAYGGSSSSSSSFSSPLPVAAPLASAADETATSVSDVHLRAMRMQALGGLRPAHVAARDWSIGTGSTTGLRALFGNTAWASSPASLGSSASLSGASSSPLGSATTELGAPAPSVTVKGTFNIVVPEAKLMVRQADGSQTPMLKLKPGVNVNMVWPNARLQKEMSAGNVKFFAESVKLRVMFSDAVDHHIEVEGIRARESEFGFGQGAGWLQKVVTGQDIASGQGAVTVNLMDRPLTESAQFALAHSGHLIGNLESTYQKFAAKKVAIVDAESPIYHFYVQQCNPATGAPLNRPLAVSEHQTVQMPLEKFEECCRETTQFFDEELPTLDLAKVAVTIQPLRHTDHLGKPVGASFVAATFAAPAGGRGATAALANSLVTIRGDLEFVGKTYAQGVAPAASATGAV